MKIPSPGFLIEAFAQVLRRFPTTVLCACIGVAATFIIIENNDNTDEWARACLVCLLGLPFLTGLVAFSESKGWDEKRGLMLQGVGIVLLASYWFWLDVKAEGFEYRVLPGYMTLVLVAHLFVAVAPYLNDRPVRDFWEYNKELFANIIVGASFTLILFAGLSLAILAVDQLFDLSLRQRIYPRLFSLLAGIFNTVYFLYHLPKNYSFNTSDDGTYSTIFKSLCKFILIPIVGLYFLILYAYSFKIIGTWSLPRGWVGSLVTGFSVAGIFTYLLNFYLPEQDAAPHIRAYRRWFWWVLFPLTILLFVAVGRRIFDYGVTEMRFLVAGMGVWIALTCLYFFFSKKDNIKFIPISLGLFVLAYAFGPLSGRAVAERSQVGRITQILEQTGRLENGKMKPGTSPVTAVEFEQFESAIYFLEKRKRLNVLNTMLPMPIENLPEMPGFYGNAGKLRGWLGMGGSATERSNQAYVSVSSNTELDPVDIRGYAMFQSISLNRSSEITFKYKGDYFSISADGKWLEWWRYDGKSKKEMIEKLDLQGIIKKWLDLRSDDNSYIDLSKKDNTVDLRGKNGTVRLVIQSGRAEMKDGAWYMEDLSGFLFVK